MTTQTRYAVFKVTTTEDWLRGDEGDVSEESWKVVEEEMQGAMRRAFAPDGVIVEFAEWEDTNGEDSEESGPQLQGRQSPA